MVWQCERSLSKVTAHLKCWWKLWVTRSFLVESFLYGKHCALHKAQAWNILFLSIWDSESGRNQSHTGPSWFLWWKWAEHKPLSKTNMCFWSPHGLFTSIDPLSLFIFKSLCPKEPSQKLHFWNNFHSSFNLQGKFSGILLYLDFDNRLRGSVVQFHIVCIEYTLKYKGFLMVLCSKALWAVWGSRFFGDKNELLVFYSRFFRSGSLMHQNIGFVVF